MLDLGEGAVVADDHEVIHTLAGEVSHRGPQSAVSAVVSSPAGEEDEA